MSKKILMIDDEDIVHQSVKRIFDKDVFQFFSAYNGNEGTKMAADIIPDIILLDINMPEMDGYAVIRSLRSNRQTKHIPVIMISGLGEVVDKVVGYELGVEDYISKPFDVNLLRERVENTIQ